MCEFNQKKTKENKNETARSNKKHESKCISRESNTGPIDGNDGFYH